MPSTFRSSYNWPEHIAQWRAGSLTRAEYCRQHDLKFHTFIYQLKRQQVQTKALTLVPVQLCPATVSSELVLHGPKGWSLAMADNVSPVWLAALLGGLA